MPKICSALMASIVLVLSPAIAVAQETSPLEAFKAYQAALQQGDIDAAYAASKEAYELAAAQWGDSRQETGLLSSNYAYMLTQRKEYDAALTVYGQCEQVLLKYQPDARFDLTNCQLQAGYLHLLQEEKKKAELAFRRVLDTAGDVPADNKDLSGITGEASLALARIYYPEKIELDEMDDDYSEQLELTREFAERALTDLTNAYGSESPDVAMAHFFIGLYHEARQAQAAAAYAYEQSYTIRLKALGKDNDLTKQSFGRMMFNGGAQPDSDTGRSTTRYDEDGCSTKTQDGEVISVCIIRRTPPRYPDRASNRGRFGFAHIIFDIGTDGKTKNIREYASWPDGFFGESSINAVRRWKYSEPVNEEGEPREWRDVVAFFRFELEN